MLPGWLFLLQRKRYGSIRAVRKLMAWLVRAVMEHFEDFLTEYEADRLWEPLAKKMKEV